MLQKKSLTCNNFHLAMILTCNTYEFFYNSSFLQRVLSKNSPIYYLELSIIACLTFNGSSCPLTQQTTVEVSSAIAACSQRSSFLLSTAKKIKWNPINATTLRPQNLGYHNKLVALTGFSKIINDSAIFMLGSKELICMGAITGCS